MQPLTTRLLFIPLALLLASSTALAQDIQVGLEAVAPRGRTPELVVAVRRAARNIHVSLDAEDGATIRVNTGKVKAGQEKRIPLKQPEGEHRWTGTLTADFVDADEPATMPLKFETAVLPPPQLSLDPADVHLEDRRVEVTLNRAARKLVFTVTGDDGTVVDRGESTFKDLPAGEKLPVTWNGPPDTRILRVDIVGHDRFGLFSPTLSLFPWSLDIPHQDVNFESGQAVIPPSELPKVQAAAEDIKLAIKRYGKLVDVKLYVGGYTDTVGGADTNEKLSLARAQAIGAALRRAGVKASIFARGYGEGNLKVDTPDETDEPRNRRATYTLAVEPPGSGWSPL